MAQKNGLSGVALGALAGGGAVAVALVLWVMLGDRGGAPPQPQPVAVVPDPAPQAAIPQTAAAPEPAVATPEPAPATPDAATAALAAPRFDTFRLGEDGLAVVAGIAFAGATVDILIDGQDFNRATAGSDGRFAALFSLAPSEMPRAMTLRATAPDGRSVLSDDVLMIAPAPVEEPAQAVAAAEPAPEPPAPAAIAPSGEPPTEAPVAEVPAAPGPVETAAAAPAAPVPEPVAATGAAAEAPPVVTAAAPPAPPVEQAVAAAPAEPVAVAVPEPVASATPGTAAVPQQAGTTAEPSAVAELPVVQADATAPSALAGQGMAAAPAAAPVTSGLAVAAVPGTAAAPPAPETADVVLSGTAGAAPPPRPSNLLITQQGVSVLRGSTGGLALSIDSIAYSGSGTVEVAGRSRAGARVRLYLNNSLQTETATEPSGIWRSSLVGVAPGLYTLRADQVSESGTVSARSETPFLRETPEALAAAQSRIAAASPPDPARADPGTAAPPALPAQVVTVQPGFTLWGIARATYGSGIQYVKVFEANRDQIRNPDLIYPGQVFALPQSD